MEDSPGVTTLCGVYLQLIPELAKGFFLNLTNSLSGEAQTLTNFLEGHLVGAFLAF